MWSETQNKNCARFAFAGSRKRDQKPGRERESCALNNRFTQFNAALVDGWLDLPHWVGCRFWMQLQQYERMIYDRNVDASLERHFVCKQYRDSEKWCAYFILGYNFLRGTFGQQSATTTPERLSIVEGALFIHRITTLVTAYLLH